MQKQQLLLQEEKEKDGEDKEIESDKKHAESKRA